MNIYKQNWKWPKSQFLLCESFKPIVIQNCISKQWTNIQEASGYSISPNTAGEITCWTWYICLYSLYFPKNVSYQDILKMIYHIHRERSVFKSHTKKYCFPVHTKNLFLFFAIVWCQRSDEVITCYVQDKNSEWIQNAALLKTIWWYIYGCCHFIQYHDINEWCMWIFKWNYTNLMKPQQVFKNIPPDVAVCYISHTHPSSIYTVLTWKWQKFTRVPRDIGISDKDPLYWCARHNVWRFK